MNSKDFFELAIQVITGFGILVSIWGTYRLTRAYHAYDSMDFARTTIKTLWLTGTERAKRTEMRAKVASRLGNMNTEEKAESLLGIYWIFIGFVFQLIGTVCSFADVIWTIRSRVPHP